MNRLCAISSASLSQLSKFTFASFSIKMELTKSVGGDDFHIDSVKCDILNHGMNVSLDASPVTLYKEAHSRLC